MAELDLKTRKAREASYEKALAKGKIAEWIDFDPRVDYAALFGDDYKKVAAEIRRILEFNEEYGKMEGINTAVLCGVRRGECRGCIGCRFAYGNPQSDECAVYCNENVEPYEDYTVYGNIKPIEIRNDAYKCRNFTDRRGRSPYLTEKAPDVYPNWRNVKNDPYFKAFRRSVQGR